MIALVLIRAFSLSHDPPPELFEWGLNVGEFLYDEGWWTANARDHALFGQWLSGGFDPILITPLSSLIFRLSFLIFGVGLVQARAVSVILGTSGLLVLFMMLRDLISRRAALWGLVLLGMYFPLVICQRTALLETTVLFFVLVSIWLWLRGKPLALFGCGLALFAAILTKPTSIVAAVPVCLATLLLPHRSRIREVAGLAAGLLAGAVVWWSIWGYSHLDGIARMMSFYSGPRWQVIAVEGGRAASLLKAGGKFVLGGIMQRHVLFRANPVFIVLALLGALECLRRVMRTASERRFLLLALTWLIVGGIMVSILPYQPLRYYLLLSPAMAILAASMFVPTRQVNRLSRGKGLLGLAMLAVVMCQAAYVLTFGVARRWVAGLGLPQRSAVSPAEFSLTSTTLSALRTGITATVAELSAQDGLLFAATLAALAAVALGLPVALLLWHLLQVRRAKRESGEGGGGGRSVGRGILLGLALLSLCIDSYRLAAWAASSRATVRELGQNLAETLPPDAVISPGGTYSLGSGLRFDNSSLLRREMWSLEPPATHILVLLEHPLVGESTGEEFADRHRGVRFVERFEVFSGRAALGLFAIEGRSSGKPEFEGASAGARRREGQRTSDVVNENDRPVERGIGEET
jgi:hypothetical protein